MKKITVFIVLLLVLVSIYADGFTYSRHLSIHGEYMLSFVSVNYDNKSTKTMGSQINAIVSYNEYFNRQSRVGVFVDVMPFYKLLTSYTGSQSNVVDSSWHTLADQLVINGGFSVRYPYDYCEFISDIGLHYERASLSGVTMTCIGLSMRGFLVYKVTDNFALNMNLSSVLPISYRLTEGSTSVSCLIYGALSTFGLGASLLF